ncbi:hypothetical protein ACWEBX_27285 [Streptomyces sp. NPDC005070]
MNGLQPKITEDESASHDKYKLECPQCGETGRYRFALLARRAFEEHTDEKDPVVESPLDQVRTFLDCRFAFSVAFPHRRCPLPGPKDTEVR